MTFDQVDINIGDGFDGSSGIFRAPLSGIYRMSFSGQSAAYIIDYTQIMVYKNGYPIFFITDGNEAEKADGNNVTLDTDGGGHNKIISRSIEIISRGAKRRGR